MADKIIAYKAFNPDMTCRGFQYAEGKEYEQEGGVRMCEQGFHACENPIDTFQYYAPANSVWHEVELSGKIEREQDDSKVCASKIKIGASIDIAGLCRAAFEFVRSKCTNEYNAEPGKPATAGDGGAATAGEYGAATAGYRGAATAGYRGAATAGCRGAATSRGSSKSGGNGLSVARGNNVKVCGGLGAILVIAEENDDNYEIKDWIAVQVDGVNVKADTWYKLVDGQLVEVESVDNNNER
jgi:hypothetical protein